MKNGISVIAIIVLFSSACSERKNLSPVPSISSEAKNEINKPVNCLTANQDLAALEQERASVAKRMLSGVRSVFPVAVVAGILMGDYRDRVKVAVGSYNSDIEAKASEIRAKCNLR